MKSRYVVGILLAIVALLYLPFLGNAFISDDSAITAMRDTHFTWMNAVGLPSVIHLGGLVHYWIYHIFGLVPWPYRLVNILFHAGNVILVWLIVRKHTRRLIAFIAALLFAVHPLATESVVWIAGGVVYAYSAFFFLLSLYWYGNTSFVKRMLSVLSFILALCMSQSILPLFIIFGLYEWMFGDVKRNWKRLIPYIVLTITFILFYMTRTGSRISGAGEFMGKGDTQFYNPFFQLPIAISWYTQLFVWPKHLTIYHVGLFNSWGEFVARVAETVVYLGIMLIGMVRRQQWGFWLAWVLIALGVTLLPITIAWIVAERYVYVGLVGFCVITAIIFERVLSNKKWRVAGMVIGIFILIALATRTMVRNSEWRTEDSFYLATLRESPEDPRSWNYLGNVYGRQGMYDKALEAFAQAIQLNPNFAEAYHNSGNIYFFMKNYDEAASFFQKTVAIKPTLWESYQMLMVIAEERKEYKLAREYLEKALRINPDDSTLKQDVQRLQSLEGKTP